MYDFRINAGNFVPLLVFLANKNSKISSNYPAASQYHRIIWADNTVVFIERFTNIWGRKEQGNKK
jgi:hypothetical protein